MQWLISLLTGPVLSAITGPILEAYKAKLGAENSKDGKIVELAAKAIDAEIDARREATKFIVAEQGRWWTAAPRAITCWSFAIFVAKVVVWDKVLGLGSTDPLTGDVAGWAGAVMVTWFGGRSLEKIAGSIATIFKR
jgi:hypothetical protein